MRHSYSEGQPCLCRPLRRRTSMTDLVFTGYGAGGASSEPYPRLSRAWLSSLLPNAQCSGIVPIPTLGDVLRRRQGSVGRPLKDRNFEQRHAWEVERKWARRWWRRGWMPESGMEIVRKIVKRMRVAVKLRSVAVYRGRRVPLIRRWSRVKRVAWCRGEEGLGRGWPCLSNVRGFL
jgi:hypothetical protein